MSNNIHNYITLLILLSPLCFNQPAFSAPNKTSAPWIGDSLMGAPCTGNPQRFGPFDYLHRKSFTYELNIVEKYHFNETKQDLDYTLRAWPNHHKALYASVRYRIDSWAKRVPAKKTPAECYLQRAINFSPKDGTTQMLYAILLHRTKHKSMALEQYRSALEVEPNNAQVKYNLGLLLVELGKFDEANQYAQEVYSRGYPLPGLKNKLIKAGRWKNITQESTDVSEVHQQSN